MGQLSKKELEKIFSLYLDDELDTREKEKFDEYLSTHPRETSEFELYKKIRTSLAHKKTLPANDWFWLKLSDKLEKKEISKTFGFLFHNPAVALSSISLLIFAVITGVYIKDGPLVQKFFFQKKEMVQNSLLAGNFFPLFTNLNKDDVLNFALFGSLPVDSAKKTELQVKNNSDGKEGQVEIVQRDNKTSARPVSVEDFCQRVGMKEPQRLLVDSMLDSFRQKLQTSVLVSENRGIAIHEELAEMNRAMVNTIAASLEPVQRGRFQKFLTQHSAPYSVVAMNAPVISPQVLLHRIPALSRSNRYVFVSRDTIGIAEMRLNVDSIRDAARKNTFRSQRVAAERMMRDIAELRRDSRNNLLVEGSRSAHVDVHSSGDAFQIKFETTAPMMEFPDISNMVRPRMEANFNSDSYFRELQMIGDSAFVMEMYPDSQVLRILRKLPSGEFRYEYVDSAAAAPAMKLFFKSNRPQDAFEQRLRAMNKNQEKLIDLDSLLRESEKKSIESQPSAPKKKVKLLDL